MSRILIAAVTLGMVASGFSNITSADHGGTHPDPTCPDGWTLDAFSSTGAALIRLDPAGAVSLAKGTIKNGNDGGVSGIAVNEEGVPNNTALVKFDQGAGTTKVCRGPEQETSGHDEVQWVGCFITPDGQTTCQPMSEQQCQKLRPPVGFCQGQQLVHIVDTYVVPIEMVAMELQGVVHVGKNSTRPSIPIRELTILIALKIRESPTLPSMGQVVGTRVSTPSGDQYQLDSFFDIFYELSFDTDMHDPVTGQKMFFPGNFRGTNCVTDADGKPVQGKCQAFRVEAHFAPGTTLPPHSDNDQPYQHPVGNHSVIWSTDGLELGSIVSGCHKPYQTAFPLGHRICTLFSGTESSVPGTADTCLQNDVEIGVVDLSNPPHTISGVGVVTSGPLTLSPWDSSDPDMWVSSASTTSIPCADVGVSLSASYTDGDSSPTVVQNWRQHA
ncbi:MAG: hypothetical protein HY556_07455 [Euryarchaeota archaeon]|nr:hypothetical protein [Euryarchaeota archaeon]